MLRSDCITKLLILTIMLYKNQNFRIHSFLGLGYGALSIHRAVNYTPVYSLKVLPRELASEFLL